MTADIVHDGVPGVLRVRQLPRDFARASHPFVALAWSDEPLARGAIDAATRVVQDVLEADGHVLLVASHWQADRSTWYAYAASSELLDAAMAAARERQPLGWGVNPDDDWAEYDNMLRLVGQAMP